MAQTHSVGQVFLKEQEIRSYKSDPFWILPNTMIGLELEYEGILNPIKSSPFWTTVLDNSLRRINDIEPIELRFILPLCGEDLTTALSQLERGLLKTKLVPLSERTSTHVHIDVRDLKLHQLLKFIIIYTVFETTLFKFCEPHRRNNIFCLPFSKAEANLFDRLSTTTLTHGGHLQELARERYRYSALNLDALRKFGSLEFRHLEGTFNINKIKTWINLILSIKRDALSKTSVNIKDIPKHYSAVGFKECAEQVFKEHFNILNTPDLQMDIIEGIRLAQDIIYRENLEHMPGNLHQEYNSTWSDTVPNEALQQFIKQNNIVPLDKKIKQRTGIKIPNNPIEEEQDFHERINDIVNLNVNPIPINPRRR